MKRLWSKPLPSLLLLCVAALVSWPVFGHTAALIVFSSGLLFLLLHHIHNLSSLYRWLNAPRSKFVPEGTGSWQYIFSAVRRLLKTQRVSAFNLSKALDRFQKAGAVFPDAVVLLDDSDTISWCNPMAESYFGLRMKRDQGAQITYILRQPQFSRYLMSGKVSEPLTLRLQGNLGERVVSIQLVPYGNSQQLLLGRDITHWERMETTRRDFIANVSHELRTPLTVVGGYLETLLDGSSADPEFLARSIQLMSEQTNRMTRLVEDLLTLSRLENTKAVPIEESVNVPALLQSVLADAQALSGGRHQIRLVENASEWLKGSEDELRSAFGNLVSNAVRYTPDGETISLTWERAKEGIAFSVQDGGIGIEPQHIARITERFYRVDTSRSRESGGTGLGLAIVKHVVNRHEGQLDIESSPGKGSKFTIVFPESRVVVGPEGKSKSDEAKSAQLRQSR